MEIERLRNAWQTVRDELLAERTPDGHWVGELSSSALATATAVSALSVVRKGQISDFGFQISDFVDRGVAWLVRQQNEDGGFGDTDKSYSNIATTYLVVAAIHLAGKAAEHRELLARAEKYIDSKGRLEGLKARYGIDKTFVVPIMTNLAIAGLVKWEEISPLPFELAVVPQSWYRFVGMPVVSYAIPALVAIGQAHFHHKKPWNPLTRLVRWLSITRSLTVLRRMQPESGGYLEATPLTSFVVMSLASMWSGAPASRVGSASGRPLAEQTDHIAEAGNSRSELTTLVIREGVKFLANSVRPDGSWPIDTNLATWVTTLSINSLAAGGEDVAALLGPKCLDWLLSCQHTQRHPFTGADPGGWGWSDLSGAVPDADDTAGALLALAAWRDSPSCTREQKDRITAAAQDGLEWLIRLQNRDGGWPTFCRGWGKLPFDRSGVDLTEHVQRARWAFRRELNGQFRRSVADAWRRDSGSLWFTLRSQGGDGSWCPLWFGNQDSHDEANRVYGTAKVLISLFDAESDEHWVDFEIPEGSKWGKALGWLVANQNADGGWGSGVWNKRVSPSDEVGQVSNLPSHHSPLTTHHSPLTSSVEETALAVEALLPVADWEQYRQSVERGLEWLVTAVERGDHRNAAPIGFYFAKLWYYEKLYPILFTASALGRACQQLRPANK